MQHLEDQEREQAEIDAAAPEYAYQNTAMGKGGKRKEKEQLIRGIDKEGHEEAHPRFHAHAREANKTATVPHFNIGHMTKAEKRRYINLGQQS